MLGKNRGSLLCFILFVFSSIALSANTDSLSVETEKRLKEAMEYIGSSEHDATIKLFQKDFDFFSKNKDLNNWLKWHRRLVVQLRKKDLIEKAFFYYDQCLDGMWKQPDSLNEYKQLATLYAEIGTIYYNIGELNPAKEYYLKYSNLLTEKTDKPAHDVAKYAYKRLANIYSGLRDFEKSKYYFDKIKSISWAAQKWDMWGEACESLALAHSSVGEYQQAVASIEEGLQMIDSVSFDTKMLLLTSLGINHYHLCNYEQARLYTDYAADLLNDNLGSLKSHEQYSYQYLIYYNYGRINKGEKNFQQSAYYYQKALDLHNNGLINLSRRRLVIMHFNFSQLYLEWGDYEKAENYQQIAIQHLLPILSNREDPDLAFSGTLTAEPLLAHAFEVMGKIKMATYKDSGVHDDLEEAISNYELAGAVGSLLLQNYTVEDTRLKALKKQRELKSASINAYYNLHQTDSNEIWKEKLFNISERSKAFLQLESANTSHEVSHWDESRRATYYQTKAHLAELESVIYQLQQSGVGNDDFLLDSLKNEYIKTSDAFAGIRNQGQGQEESKAKKQVASVTEIQQNLGNRTALIEYFVGDEELYIFCISKNDFSI